MVDGLNRLIAGALYEPEAWRAAGVELTQRAAELARKAQAGQTLTAEQRMDLNRWALESAFGPSVAKRRRIYQLGTVPRYSLIGKAAFVYWPAGFRLPLLGHLPILPNVGRMRLIR